MPFSIRRFTLQRSLSSSVTETKSQGSGPDMVGAGRAIRKSASQEEGRHKQQAASFPASRSADAAELRRPPPDRPPQLPPRGPLPQRAASVDRATPPSSGSSILSRWRHSGKSKSVCMSEPREYPLDDGNASRRNYGPLPPARSSLRVGVRFQDRRDDAFRNTENSRSFDSAQLPPSGKQQQQQQQQQQQPPPGVPASGDWQLQSRVPEATTHHTVRRPMARRQHSVSDEHDLELQRSLMELERDRSDTSSIISTSSSSRDALLRHLQLKYPQFADVIAGNKHAVLQSQLGPGGGGRGGGPGMYHPPASVYDDDPGIMSEVETSATGIRRATKARSSLPVVRTPSKTQERPLGRMSLVKPPPAEHGHWQDDKGLVFLQYRSETKRALLPNEITSIDTVKALFVRSFPKQLTMEYLDSPHIRIYIHDPSKDMFYELEDLRDIRDRSVLRIYEQDVNGGGVYSTYDQDMSYFSEPEFDSEYQNQHIHRAKASKSQNSNYYTAGPVYQNRTQTLPHGAVLRSYSPAPNERPKTQNAPHAGYSQTLPRGMTYSSMALSPEKRQPGLLVSSEFPMSQSQEGLHHKGGAPHGGPPPKPQRSYHQPLPPLNKTMRPAAPSPLTSPRSPLPRPPSVPLSQSRSLSPDHGCPQDSYQSMPFPSPTGQPYHGPASSSPRRYDLAYQGSPERRASADQSYLSSPERRLDHQRSLPAAFNSAYEEPFYGDQAGYGTRSGSATPIIDEEARMRVEYMERQLASLTGLVHKALAAGTAPRPQSHLIPTRDTDLPPEKEKSDEVCLPEHDVQKHPFKEEKSVSFSDETTTLGSHKQRQHTPQAAEKPSKPAIKGLRSHSISDDYSNGPPALPDKDGRPSKPAPPPKPASLSGALDSRQHSSSPAKELHFTPEICSQLRQLRRQTKDLRLEVRNLRRMAQAQAVTARETVRETCLKIKVMLAAIQVGEDQVCSERLRVSRDEDMYRQDVTRLEKDLSDLESQVEELRSNVINRRCRVNMGNVESMALVLSRASKTVADLKARFPSLQDSLKSVMGAEMEVVVREEKFLKEEPERLESALRRCKKLTGTLVTLKRLASVQEQRHTGAHTLPEKAASADGPHSDGEAHTARSSRQAWKRSSNFRQKIDGERLTSEGLEGTMSLDSDAHLMSSEPKGPRSENALDALLDELQTFSKADAKRRPTSADSPVRKPPVPVIPVTGMKEVKKAPPPPPRTTSRSPATSPTGRRDPLRTNALAGEEARRDRLSSNSSSSESVNSQEGLRRSRQELLDSRHQELLRKQRQLQEQYARLQLLQRLSPPKPDLKKTGSESNILHKASLSLGAPSGSLTQLASLSSSSSSAAVTTNASNGSTGGGTTGGLLRSGAKIYETDIL
ncbi:coiled-coil domain-containing protein AGAP005037-like isoform X4 [Ornithodoros turicata]|uniref:coiled-coil domain-containing protein AGAP005037-like isoform X4 n=1 Tax=Ornithodoros turicata TaxID=34597 RepID=UPI003138C33A